MINKYKKQLIISSLVILLPILVGLILWNSFPDRIATHWGIDGEADGWSSKTFAIFAIPLIMLALHWFCFWITSLDPKAKDQTRKAFNMIFWICPILSLLESAMVYSLALGVEFNITSLLMPGLSLLFILIGNYLPKCKRNYTIGIKVSWALANDENWNATHRFAGKVWVTGGFVVLLLSFLPQKIAITPMILITLAMGLVPTFYSWAYYKKQCKAGQDYDPTPASMDKTTRLITKIAPIFTAAILIFVALLLFTGEIDYHFEEDCFAIEASYWNDLTVDYDQITAVELRDENVDGTRTWGFGSWKLLLGAFENEEFGSYTRFTYYNPEACVVVTCGEKVLVLSGADAQETAAVYETITAKLTK